MTIQVPYQLTTLGKLKVGDLFFIKGQNTDELAIMLANNNGSYSAGYFQKKSKPYFINHPIGTGTIPVVSYGDNWRLVPELPTFQTKGVAHVNVGELSFGPNGHCLGFDSSPSGMNEVYFSFEQNIIVGIPSQAPAYFPNWKIIVPDGHPKENWVEVYSKP